MVPPDPVPLLIDVTIIVSTAASYTATAKSASRLGINAFLGNEGDEEKRKKHGANARAMACELVPFSLDVRGALGPSAKRFWDGLWKSHIANAPSRGESKWTAIAERRKWLQRFSVLLATENAEILMTKAGAYWNKHGAERSAFLLQRLRG